MSVLEIVEELGRRLWDMEVQITQIKLKTFRQR